MAAVVPAPPVLSGELSLFHTTDPLLANSPVLVFHGPAAKIGAATSRIQVHVLTPAGLGSYSRIAVSPNSPFYSAVANLPRDEQGDEVLRGLAFGLKKYFSELPSSLKVTWRAQVKAPSFGALFGDDHIAILASRMTRIENVDEVVGSITQAFAEQRQSWQDVDVVLPPGSIKAIPTRRDSDRSEEMTEAELMRHRYGRYAELVESLGDVAFIPTSNMKRAPSKATSIGRSASFLIHQKENARKELRELLDTEESYVERIQELQKISTRFGGDLKQSSRDQLKKVVPKTINRIVQLNSEFLKSIRAVITESEGTAVQDLESTSEGQVNPYQARQDLISDKQGIVAVAKCLCDWLPKFAQSYESYFVDHGEAAKLVKSVFHGAETALLAELQQVGEQKLTSLLIEPVQRLPRYTLYIDGITKQLPARHPAIKHLMKARDVIAEICSQDGAGNETGKIIEKLRSRVSGLPDGIQISGRLINASDFVELRPPYALDVNEVQPGVLLLFADCLILLEKTVGSTLYAKALLTELESNIPNLPSEQPGAHDLHFIQQIPLEAVDCTQSFNGKVLNLYIQPVIDNKPHPKLRPTKYLHWSLRLEAPYDGKAGKLAEDIAKARVEGRFSEPERESTHWEIRAFIPSGDHTNLFAAVHDDSIPDQVSARSSCAAARVIIDIDKHSTRLRVGEHGVRTIVAISPQRDGLWRISTESLDGSATREAFAAPDLAAAVQAKMESLSVSRFAIDHSSMTACLLAKNADILNALELEIAPEVEGEQKKTVEPRDRPSIRRPKSPVKMLSSFLSSSMGPSSHPPAALKKDLPILPPPNQSSRLPAPSQGAPKPPSRESRPGSKDQPTPGSVKSVGEADEPVNAMQKLEETLSTYVLALEARKGNIVGKSLKFRAHADELAVNELYNSVIEDPKMMVLAAQATVDVLFAAFEKFLNVAWKEQVGQVIPYSLMQDIQAKAETLFPADFDAYFSSAMSSLPPQNKRAFKKIMTLLADLLDGTGNDGDRGMLTAAFAEVLVTEGDPHHYIALIDRFVDDTETYFGEPLEDVYKTAAEEQMPQKKDRSVNSSSVNSNTSSFRKKFGFSTLNRENSKSEQESKVASVWRTLSKTARGDVSPATPSGSLSRGHTLQRSHSTDLDGRLAVPDQRPVSQDGSVIVRSPISSDEPFSSPSSNSGQLSTIGEHPSFIPKGPPRKKRRSSLSDLKTLDVATKDHPISPPSIRRSPFLKSWEDKSLPASPNSSAPSSKQGSGRFGSPTREPPRSRLPSSFTKGEHSPHINKAFMNLEKNQPSKPADEVVITPRPLSGIPMLSPLKPVSPLKISPARGGLSERPGAENIVKRPGSPPDKNASGSPTRKLRMQSPQKLRERLQTEQTALAATQTTLQEELAKLGEELSATPSRMGSIRKQPIGNGRLTATTSGPSSNADLAQRVRTLEAQLPTRLDEINNELDTLRSDLTTSLSVSETKCKKLDELYREANGENEALYARFNDELSRVMRAVRGGDGVEELRKQLRESQEEAAKLKRETARLKRENIGLRAQLRE